MAWETYRRDGKLYWRRRQERDSPGALRTQEAFAKANILARGLSSEMRNEIIRLFMARARGQKAPDIRVARLTISDVLRSQKKLTHEEFVALVDNYMKMRREMHEPMVTVQQA